MSKFEELGLRGYFDGNHRERELGYSERHKFLTQWNQFMYRLQRKRANPWQEQEKEQTASKSDREQ